MRWKKAYCPVALLVLTIACPAFAATADGPSSTMPVRTVFSARPPAAKQSTPGTGRPVLSPASKNDATSRPASQPKGTSILSPEVKQGFSADPFQLTHRSRERTEGRKILRYTQAGPGQEKPLSLGNDGKVQVQSTTPEADGKDRLTPNRTNAFSGGEHTLPNMGKDDTPPEVHMRYKLGKTTTTRLVVNPQDPASPLYRPAEKESPLNAAGVYMDIEVNPDTQLQLGGEYTDVESKATQEKSSSGASVGLKWQF